MYFYSLGYGSYEDSDRITLASEAKMSKEAFEEIVLAASVEVVREIIEKRSRANDNEDDFEYTHNFSNIYEAVADKMQTCGFRRIKYVADVSPFGWPSIFTKGDWESQRGSEDSFLNRLTDRLNAAGFNAEHDSSERISDEDEDDE